MLHVRRTLTSAIVGAALALGTAALSPGPVLAQDDALRRARSALARSNYDQAATALERAGPATLEKHYLQVRLHLWTGRYEAAVKVARAGKRLGLAARVALAPWHAEALARLGKLEAAIKVVRAVEGEAEAHRARVVLGELLIQAGKRRQARIVLMEVIAAYNDDVIKNDDAEGLSLAGRAAYLLRAYRDANSLFDKAERAGGRKRVETLLWRTELFLDKYAPGPASTVAKEAARLAPGDPRVLVALAHVKLASAMDFASAHKLVERALRIDARLASGHFVRAGLALRTMDLAHAQRSVDAGLATNATDLQLLSMKAAIRFLADDKAGFAAVEKEVLALNGEYARFYAIVSEYAEWEHRYDDIVAMMRRAVAVDPQDGKAWAQLGLNQIRNGEEAAGVAELRKAWLRDGYNPRVANTLDLYEEIIPKEYRTVDGTKFRIRYHKSEKAILERYVPRMLEQAWGSMVKRYGFVPQVPVSIELYADAEHFSVRTSGLPRVGIQGVCFGKTLAIQSPGAGRFNWGMVLWHELAHVFHIQLSKSRVPRWFTEGLAEYETLLVRDEWRREEHLSLFYGLRAGKLPKVNEFNQAFTHVDSPQDVVMAYFAASQIAVFMAEEFGFAKVVALLPQWASGKPSREAIESALGVSPAVLDKRFGIWVAKRLARYDKQFVPVLRSGIDVPAARKAVAANPHETKALIKLALALLEQGQAPAAMSALGRASKAAPSDPDVLYLQLRLALRKGDPKAAAGLVKRLLKAGHDGYAVRMKAADLAENAKDAKAMKAHLFRAHTFDPVQAEPLQALYDAARKGKDRQGQLWALRKLAKLQQHDRRVWGRLLELLLEKRLWEEARQVGAGLMYVDVTNPKVHWMYARALARTGRHISAIFELNSAIIAGAKAPDAAAIYRMMAEGYRKLGRPEYAAKAAGYASKMAARRAASAAPQGS